MKRNVPKNMEKDGKNIARLCHTDSYHILYEILNKWTNANSLCVYQTLKARKYLRGQTDLLLNWAAIF